jgi:protein TonB
VLKTTQEAFSDEVKRALPKQRFYPAEIGGHKVKQLVQQPFAFAMSK